jgi:hypothetical protein
MEDIFLKFVREKITPNSYYVLHCIKNKMIPSSFVNKELETKIQYVNGNTTISPNNDASPIS